ncbi:MAG: tetratricopeptide repeat protein, partial [Spirochaetales bacterium]
EGAGALAIHYFERVVQGYADVISKGISTRQRALTQLVDLAPDAERRARCYEILIDEYGDRMDRGLLYYRLGNTYEELGQWDAAIAAFRQFANHPESSIPGEPNAHRTITDRIKFYDSSKDWTVATAEDLRRVITWAIANKDSRTLLRYQSDVSFFTRSWEQDFEDPNATPMWDLGELLRNSRRIYVDPELAVDTEGDEAYLYTYNWGGLRIRTWYLYFRRVYFPADPEIHGTWEWAGIYLGERL